uniref:HlyD family efflux transporter periplasmic adaptor subunit n=1 Tax=Fundidesulfovibrio putealis TaxID=270496 RepID=A0A7C4ELR6_9BACT
MRALALALALTLCAGAAAAQAPAPAPAKPAEPSPLAQEITFSGKLYSPVKLSVSVPYQALIKSMSAAIGQKVKKDEVLLNYEITLETRMNEKRALSPSAVKDLEHQLAAAGKDLDRLRMRRKELEVMEKQNMATSQALALNSQEMQVVEKQRAALQERLNLEKELLEQRLDLARERFGSKANYGQLPEDGIVKAPMDGYVLWINPDLRKGVKLAPGAELFQVGTLDPILIRAQVHEIEALRLKLGDQASVVFDSIPGKTFTATVSRIPWAPLPSTLQQPSYYEIELTLPNADYTLKEGLKGLVTIIPKK